jgi:hypothetical protein
MTILIDEHVATSFLTTPVREGWVNSSQPVRVEPQLAAASVGEHDVALIQAPEATLLTRSHVIDRSVAIVHDGKGLVSMRTAVRPDEIDEATVSLTNVGAASEVLARSLLGTYFGIGAPTFVRSADDAQVEIVEGVAALDREAAAFVEDMVRTWFIFKGGPFISHVTVVGVQALADDADEQIATLRSMVETGKERRRDVRRMIHDATGVDRDELAEITGAMRFSLEPEDQDVLRALIELGTRGTRYGRSLPAFRDQLGAFGASSDVEEI